MLSFAFLRYIYSLIFAQGEVREGGSEVTGFHGWVNAYREEQAGNFVYGYSGADCGVI